MVPNTSPASVETDEATLGEVTSAKVRFKPGTLSHCLPAGRMLQVSTHHARIQQHVAGLGGHSSAPPANTLLCTPSLVNSHKQFAHLPGDLYGWHELAVGPTDLMPVPEPSLKRFTPS